MWQTVRSFTPNDFAALLCTPNREMALDREVARPYLDIIRVFFLRQPSAADVLKAFQDRDTHDLLLKLLLVFVPESSVFAVSPLIEHAIHNNRLSTVRDMKRFVEKRHIPIAFSSGHRSMVELITIKLLPYALKTIEPYECMIAALDSNDAVFIEWVSDQFEPHQPETVAHFIETALARCSLPVAQMLHVRHPEAFGPDRVMAFAAKGADLAVLMWVHDILKKSKTKKRKKRSDNDLAPYVLASAIESPNANLAVVEWLYGKRYRTSMFPECVDMAIARFLLKKGSILTWRDCSRHRRIGHNTTTPSYPICEATVANTPLCVWQSNPVT